MNYTILIGQIFCFYTAPTYRLFSLIAKAVVPNLGNRFSHKIDDADTPKEYINLIIS